MKKSVPALMFALLTCLTGCEPKFSYLYGENDEYKLYINLAYGVATRNVLDLALPKGPAHNGLVFYIHGGGWIAGYKDGYRSSLINYAKRGYACAALNYRYAGTKGVDGFDILDDITSALTKVKSTALESNINLTGALLSGGSAGGHLSLLYAYARKTEAPIKPKCVVSLSGPTDLQDPNFFQKSATNYDAQMNMIGKLAGKNVTAENYSTEHKEILKSLSPIYYVNESTVPTVICHGTADDVVPYTNATRLNDALTLSQVNHELVTFNNAGHGLEKDDAAKSRMNELFEQYVTTYLD